MRRLKMSQRVSLLYTLRCGKIQSRKKERRTKEPEKKRQRLLPPGGRPFVMESFRKARAVHTKRQEEPASVDDADGGMPV